MSNARSILFIGNSYTFYNDMPTAIFAKMAEAVGFIVDVTAITKGGHRLSQMANPEDKYGAAVEQALTGAKTYDFVILQEQSVRPAEDPSAFYAAVRDLSARVVKTGAEPILYATWGRKIGCDVLAQHNWTNESMTWRLAAAYRAIGRELNARVANVGAAFFDVYTNHTDIELYNEDLSHPSYAGSYLAAATLLAVILGVDPTAISYTGELSVADAIVLQQAARKAAFDPPALPCEYETRSEEA